MVVRPENRFRERRGIASLRILGRPPKTRAREGDFVETSEGLFFDVKGLLHPPDRIVAYLRYYPHERGARLRGRVRYGKVYDLSKRRRLLEKKWPHYLFYDEVQGRELEGVPIANVFEVHRPAQGLTALLRSARKDRLQSSAARLVGILARESKLPLTSFGISGSLLVGLHSRGSDIDVIVYGAKVSGRVQEALFALLEDNEYFHRYGLLDLRKLHARRGLQQAISFRDFAAQERRKVFQGKFFGHDYFVRCVKNLREVTEHYGETRYRPIGKSTVSAQVLDDGESLLTPCTYLLEHVRVLAGVRSHGPREVVSFRGRFAEQARKGESVLARGRLEAVLSGKSRYFRLVVGEGLTDVLRVTG